MKLFNILYLANSGEIFGGGQISLLALLSGLNRERFHPLVVCPTAGNLVDRLSKIGVETRIIRMETLRHLNIFSWIQTINRLIQLMRRRKIDLIHSNSSRATIYGGIAAMLAGIPLIWHVRIADSGNLLDRPLGGLATKIIVISKAVGKRFDWLKNKEEKVIVIYNGIDLERFNPAIDGKIIREEFGISSQAPLVGIVGRLDQYKGHQYLLQAAKKVTETMPEVRFLIVGNGERRKQFEKLTKQLSLGENVIFTGNRGDIPQILASLDLFVLSSVNEGFGRSVAEAMACGKAVVATKVGGLLEVVEDNITGSLVLPKNPDALGKTVINFLKDKEKAKEMGRAGRKRAEELFSVEGNVKKTERLYKEVLMRKIS